MILIGRKRDADEYAGFVQQMANISLNGFTQPGKKVSSRLTLVQKASIAAGWITKEDCIPDKSKRAEKKAAQRALTMRSHAKLAEIGVNPKYLHGNKRGDVKAYLNASRVWDLANSVLEEEVA